MDREALWKSCFMDSISAFTDDSGVPSSMVNVIYIMYIVRRVPVDVFAHFFYYFNDQGLIAASLEQLKAMIVDGKTGNVQQILQIVNTHTLFAGNHNMIGY